MAPRSPQAPERSRLQSRADVLRISVVVPAYECANMLSQCLQGLLASDLERSLWELIVVDDGSHDEATAAMAREHGARVVRINDGPRGPAHARNRGVEGASGTLVVFVDADVVVHPTALSQFAEAFAKHPGVAAVFGSYDSTPTDPGFVSQYRNLFHHRIHHGDAGPACTFWAGCGAIRMQAFHAVGGFDASRYTRPQIEDIDLGYRLFDAGFLSMLDPRIQGTHLKRWTLLTMLRADLMDRAIPWMALLRSRGNISVDGPLNLRTSEKILTVVTGVGVLLLLAALRTRRFDLLGLSVVCLVTVVLANTHHFLWFARVRSPLFALRAIPLRLLHYVVCAVGGAIGMFVTRRPRLESASAGRTMQIPPSAHG